MILITARFFLFPALFSLLRQPSVPHTLGCVLFTGGQGGLEELAVPSADPDELGEDPDCRPSSAATNGKDLKNAGSPAESKEGAGQDRYMT